jgi:AcrR family transcriptional regulator
MPKPNPKEARREHVIEAAMCLLAQKGFRGTTTKEIAEAAGINEALIFRYCKSKPDLYSAILDHQSQKFNTELWLEELTEIAKANDDAAVFGTIARRIIVERNGKRELLHLMLYSALEGHELARQFRDRQVAPLEKFLYRYIGRRQREGAFVKFDTRAIARGFIAMCGHHVLITELFGKHPDGLSDPRIADCYTEFFLRAVQCDRRADSSITKRQRGK